MQCPGNLPLNSDIDKSSSPCDTYMHEDLKIFANNFAIPLTNIFKEFFQTQTFPLEWKKYRIIEVSKTTLCNSVDDIRPIALTSVLGKLQKSFYEDINGKISKYGVCQNYRSGYYIISIKLWMKLEW